MSTEITTDTTQDAPQDNSAANPAADQSDAPIVVVTGSARPQRRFDVAYAVNALSQSEVQKLAPLNMADLLGKLLKGKLVHVNLIPLNPTPGSEWDASPKPVEQEFVRRLRAGGVNATVRDTRGREIAGACGQLAALD